MNVLGKADFTMTYSVPLRVGIVGCGGIAVQHANAVASLADRLVLAAACGRQKETTQAFVEKHGGTAFTDLDAMIDAGIDLAIVTIPPFARRGEVEHLASRGVHLLVEKPISLDLAAGEDMACAVASSGVQAAIGFMYRHGSAVQAWRKADTGPIGMMTAEYHCNHLHASWWREQAKSGGQIVEQAIHLIDLMVLCMGAPDTVYARRVRLFHNEPGYDVEDASGMVFGWNDGRMAVINANNIAVHGVWHKQWAIFGREMTGRFADWDDAVFIPSDGRGEARRIQGGTDPFVAQLIDLVSAIRTGSPLIAPLAGGVETQRVAIAALRSADERHEVRVSDV